MFVVGCDYLFCLLVVLDFVFCLLCCCWRKNSRKNNSLNSPFTIFGGGNLRLCAPVSAGHLFTGAGCATGIAIFQEPFVCRRLPGVREQERGSPTEQTAGGGTPDIAKLSTNLHQPRGRIRSVAPVRSRVRSSGTSAQNV